MTNKTQRQPSSLSLLCTSHLYFISGCQSPIPPDTVLPFSTFLLLSGLCPTVPPLQAAHPTTETASAPSASSTSHLVAGNLLQSLIFLGTSAHLSNFDSCCVSSLT